MDGEGGWSAAPGGVAQCMQRVCKPATNGTATWPAGGGAGALVVAHPTLTMVPLRRWIMLVGKA